MATLPPRNPTSAFPPSRRRRSILEKCPSLTSLRGCAYEGSDFWIPRGPPAPSVSIPYLREAINSLDTKMASLMSQRHELESHLERAVRSQSPVLRIPSEILSNIFVIGVLDLGEESIMISTLMLVCRYWAEVALSTPELWAKITVGPHDSLQKARRRLERSQNHPLDVSISFGNRMEYGTNVTDQICGAMDLLRPAFGRVRSFQLDVPNRPTAHAALLRCQEDAPLLETLSIRVNHALQDDLYSRPTLPLFNGNTPRLRSLSLASFNFGWDPKLVCHLRILNLDGYFNGFTPSAQTLLGFLRECPELEELVLRNFSGGEANNCRANAEDTSSGMPKIQLKHLRKIRFYYSGIALTRQIMEHITFPSLESLEMSYLENITPIINQLYDQAVSRLPLKHLRIETCLFNEMKFINLLRRLGSLVVLQLVDIEDISSYTLKTLASSQPWVCPKLDALCIDGCTSLEWDHIRTFVESRLPANPPKFHTSPISLMSTASAAAAAAEKALQKPQRAVYPTAVTPQRLRAIDITRCTQISKDMIQWLRMYVADVRWETAKGAWGESSLS